LVSVGAAQKDRGSFLETKKGNGMNIKKRKLGKGKNGNKI